MSPMHSLTNWPVEWAKTEDIYCFQQEILDIGNSKVLVDNEDEMILLGSYSYLGLLNHPRINEAAINAIKTYGTGTHGVRLLSGTLPIHKELEMKIANFKSTQRSIVYSSGYVANLSTIAALTSKNDAIICDKLDHASIIDGCRLSGARLMRFNHNDMNDLERKLRKNEASLNKFVIVDAVFSMDGDIIDLPKVNVLCKQYNASLMVDEAHSIGVLGQNGTGIEEHYCLPSTTIDIKMGTLSKAIPSVGGFIASNERTINKLKHESSGFIYSGALPPAQTAAALAAIDLIQQEKYRMTKLRQNIAIFNELLFDNNIKCSNMDTPIFPIIFGSNESALRAAKFCQNNGVFVQGIPHPVVPKGTARLRCCVLASHDTSSLEKAVSIIAVAYKKYAS